MFPLPSVADTKAGNGFLRKRGAHEVMCQKKNPGEIVHLCDKGVALCFCKITESESFKIKMYSQLFTLHNELKIIETYFLNVPFYTTCMEQNNVYKRFLVVSTSLLFLTIAPTSGHKCVCLMSPRLWWCYSRNYVQYWF